MVDIEEGLILISSQPTQPEGVREQEKSAHGCGFTDRPLVILHGWSDTAESIRPFARFLQERLNQDNISIISLAIQMSMEDDSPIGGKYE